MTLPARDIDSLRAVERAFGIIAGPPQTEAELDARTVQASLLVDMLQALRDVPDMRRTLSPDTPLTDLTTRARPVTQDWLQDLGARADLDLVPDMPLSLGGQVLRIGAAAALVAVASGLTLTTGEWGGLLLLLALPSALWLDLPRRLPRQIATIGDLLRACLHRNHARLRTPMPPTDTDARGQILAELCAQITAPPRTTRPPLPPIHPSEAMPWQT